MPMSPEAITIVVLSASTAILFILTVMQYRRSSENQIDSRFDEVHRTIGMVRDEWQRDLSSAVDSIERRMEVECKRKCAEPCSPK